MIGNDAPLFGRVMTAMVTPFDDELKIDFKALEKIVEHLLSNGTETIVVCGTTGESPTLDESEKKELLKAVIQQVKKRAKVIMGTGTNDTAKSIKYSRDAESVGVDGLLVVAPYYNKPSQDGLLAHFEAIAKSTSLPVVVYNIPGRTGINIGVETTVELAKRCSNIHAVKDSTGNTDQAAEIAGKARDSFRIYSGDDYLTLPLLSVGASGVVSVASHLIGSEMQKMINLFFAGKLDEARRIHYEYLPLFKGLFTAPNPTCVKYALSQLGLCKPHLRLPLVPITGAPKETMDKLLKDLHAKAGIA
ncbi:MAG TPA: 4-hydroxy-tetrahydrodipicolinate synthase [Candidatus Obscuribacterales bacterium]